MELLSTGFIDAIRLAVIPSSIFAASFAYLFPKTIRLSVCLLGGVIGAFCIPLMFSGYFYGANGDALIQYIFWIVSGLLIGSVISLFLRSFDKARGRLKDI